MKKFFTWLNNWLAQKQSEKHEKFLENLEEWEKAAAFVPCSCRREFATPWLHDKNCPRWNLTKN